MFWSLIDRNSLSSSTPKGYTLTVHMLPHRRKGSDSSITGSAQMLVPAGWSFFFCSNTLLNSITLAPCKEAVFRHFFTHVSRKSSGKPVRGFIVTGRFVSDPLRVRAAMAYIVCCRDEPLAAVCVEWSTTPSARFQSELRLPKGNFAKPLMQSL